MSKAPRKLAVGAKVGDGITILGAVDTGGHAPVYIAWDHFSWCPVACKVFATPSRAAEEAAILGALSHPNIVRFHGEGAAPPHLCMEFLEGPTLGDMLRKLPRRQARVGDALRTAVHMGAALAHMHRRDILHLDVKPSNVIIARGRPVMFDLGTARRRKDWALPCVEGTYLYMAPEQCIREAVVSPATDVFGLAMTLYQMLAGRLPFPRGSKSKPHPQIERDAMPIRRYRPAVPVGLEALLARCLARDPAARPRTIDAVLPALHGFIKSGPRMWPEGFEPGAPAPVERKPAAGASAWQTLRLVAAA